MQPKEHVAYGAAASLCLLPALPPERVAFFFAGSVLIDIDHYLDFLYFSRFREWSPSGMFRFHGRLAKVIHKPGFCALEAFHTAEFFLGILLLGLALRSPE